MAIVIAEAGENHCGDREMARNLVDVAAASGADYIKFQLYDAAKVAEDDPERDWFARVQLSDADWRGLVNHAQDKGIKPLATPWSVEKADLIFSTGVSEIKISSFHTVDLELLEHVAERASTVFISSGMTSLDELDLAIKALMPVETLFLLHCVSEYPLAPEKANLRVIDTLRERYGDRAHIGYSDHSVGILAPVTAVARGAEVIEKHITLGHLLPGTDHVLSADPEELAEMVRQIRTVERLLGHPEKMLTDGEATIQDFMRNRFRHDPANRKRSSGG